MRLYHAEGPEGATHFLARPKRGWPFSSAHVDGQRRGIGPASRTISKLSDPSDNLPVHRWTRSRRALRLMAIRQARSERVALGASTHG